MPPPEPPPDVTNPNLSNQEIYERIYAAISERRLLPGTKLSEERLAQERAAIAMAMIAAEENPTPDRLRAARIALNAARYVERLRAQLAGTAAP